MSNAPKIPSLPAQAVGIDVETTSLDPATGEIIEFAAIRFNTASGGEINRFTKLCRPSRPLSAQITAITGITNELVKGEQQFSFYRDELRQFIGNDVVFAHNASFDLNYLAYQGIKLNNPVWDTFILAGIAWPEAPSYNLGLLHDDLVKGNAGKVKRGNYSESSNKEHRAAWDVTLTWMLLQKIRENLAISPAGLNTVYEILDKSGQRQVKPLFTSKAGKTGEASKTSKASLFATTFAKATVVKKAMGDKNEASIEQILGEDGLLAKNLPGFSPRTSQIKMAEFVVDVQKKGEIGLVEAPPGTGKTYAYMAPVIAKLLGDNSARRGPRCIISTYSRHLQDQLFEDDLPKIMAAIGNNIQVAMLKGRRNYLCLTRLKKAIGQKSLTSEAAWFLIKLVVWLEKGGTGDLERLNTSHQYSFLLRWLHADTPECRQICEKNNRECPYYLAKYRAWQADLLIINHALLTQLMATGDGEAHLPHLIIDEAHHLEEAAREATRRDFSEERWLEMVSGLNGLLKQYPKYQQKHAREELKELVVDYKVWHNLVRQFMNHLSPEDKYLLSYSTRKNSRWINLRDKGLKLRSRLQFIIGLLQGMTTNSSVDIEQKDYIHEAEDLSRDYEAFLSGDTARIQWLDINKADGDVSLNDVALSVRDRLANIFDLAESVVLTSATLTVNGKYTYVKHNLGIPDARELILASPYNLREQMMIYIVDNSRHPQDSSYGSYSGNSIVEIATLISGRLLALFTSDESVRQAYNYTLPRLNQAHIRLMAQNMTGGRHQIIARFKNEDASVLFGTYGLWEGVDVPGESLSCVVIVKLPFMPPHDPVIDTIAEKEKMNSFLDQAVPRMILRLRQGIGRLIRTKTDKGALVILDSRFLQSDYGNQVLSSLPPAHIHIGSHEDLIPKLRSWFGEETIERWRKKLDEGVISK